MHVEPELEALLKRLAPGCEEQWVGASADEIDELEIQAGVELPRFYRWFLERMGHNMGPFVNPRTDLSVTTVLNAYRLGTVVTRRPNLLLIGIEPDDVVPMYLYCDLSKPTRDDAMVRSFDPQGGFIQNEFETLREMVGWNAFIRFRMNNRAQRCIGTFRTDQRHILAQLEPVVMALGFTNMLPSGRFLGIYDRSDAALECMSGPDDSERGYIFFELGADDESTIRSILGTIAFEGWLQVEVRKWLPRLRIES